MRGDETKMILSHLQNKRIWAVIFLVAFVEVLGGCNINHPVKLTKTNSEKVTTISFGKKKSFSQNKEVKKTSSNTEDLGNLGKPFDQPALSDNTLVWAGDYEGQLHDADALFSMDLKTRSKKTVAVSKYHNLAHISCPQISQDWITWLDSGMGRNNVPEYLLEAVNRKTGRVFDIARFSQVSGNSHVIAWDNLVDNRLIWSEPAGKDTFLLNKIDLTNMTKSTIKRLHTEIAPAPYQSGNTLVWEDGFNNWTGQNEVLDLTTNKLKTFKVDGRLDYPKIYGTYLLYSPQTTSDSPRDQLTYVNLTTGKSVTLNPIYPYYWTIGNGFITWSDYSKGDSTIFVKNITNNSQPIELGTGSLPTAFGDRIIWQSNDGTHIYLTKMEL